MKAAQRVVRNIRRVLQAGRIPPEIDAVALATEYANRCREVNERLRLCQRFVNAGLLTEALHEAESKPVVLDLAASLDFPEASKWSTLCLNNSWPAGEEIDAACVRLLSNVYGMATALQPLKSEYCRAVPAHDYKRCVALLRQIAACEPENRNWVEDLARFEESRAAEIGQEFRQADRDDDLLVIENLAAELDQKWVINVAQMRQAAASAVQRVRRKEALATGHRVLAEIANAYAAFDVMALKRALQSYAELLSGGDFLPDRDMERQRDEAAEWLAQKQEQERKEHEFQGVLHQLRTELDRDQPNREVERLWRALTAFDRSLPDDVEARTRHAIENRRLWEVRRTRRVIVLSAVGGAAVLAIALFAVWRVQYDRARSFYLAELDKRFAACDLAGFESTLAEAERDRPILIGGPLKTDPVWRNSASRMDELRITVSDRKARLAECLRRLKAKQAEGFIAGVAEISALLQDGGTLALTEADRATIGEFRRAWSIATEKRCSEQNDKLLTQLHAMEAILADFDVTKGDPGVLQANAARLDECIAAGRLISGVAPAVRQSFDSLVGETERRKKGVEARVELRRRLRAAPSIRGYLDAARNYLEQFPLDAFTEVMKPVVERSQDYRYLAALGPSGTNLTQIREATVAVEAENGFWSGTVNRFLGRETRLSVKWPEIRPTLQSLRDDKTLVSLYTFEQRRSGRIYLQGSGGGGAVVCGNMYEPKPADTTSRFVSKSLLCEDVIGLKIMPHCPAIEAFLSPAATVSAESSEDFLIRALADVSVDRTRYMNEMLRLKIMKFLTSQLVELTGQGGIPDAEIALQTMNAADDENFSWLCNLHPDFANKNAAAGRALSDLAPAKWLTAEPRVLHVLDRLALSRGAKWVGFVDEHGAAVLLSGFQPAELWGLRGETGARPHVDVVAELTDKGRYQSETPFVPGEPLLAPGDDKATLPIVRAVARSYGYSKEKLEGLAWPASWPSNRRTLPAPAVPNTTAKGR